MGGKLKTNLSVVDKFVGGRNVFILTPYKFYEFLLILIWGRYFIIDYAKVVLTKIPVLRLLSGWIILFIFFLCVCISLQYITKTITKSDTVVFIIMMFIYIFNILIFPLNEEYLYEKMDFLWLSSIPLYFIGIRFDVNKEINILKDISILNICAQWIYMLFFGTAMSTVASLYEGNMDAAYKILPHICLVLLFTLKKPNIINVITSVLGFLYVVSSGTRGAMLCMLVFIALYLAIFKEYKRPWLAYSMLAVVVAFILKMFDVIVSFLENFANNIGMSIRIFDKLANGDFFKSSGRNEIQDTLLKAISQKPFGGYGIGGDHTIAGSYAHNIIIEFWVSFGVVLGTALLLWLMFIILNAFKKTLYENEKGLILVLVCACFMKLFLSGTYLDETYFFFMIGICMGVIRRYKRAKYHDIVGVQQKAL